MTQLTQNPRDSIRSWLAESLAEITEDGALSFVCMQHQGGQGEQEIYSIKSGGPKWGDADAMADLLFTVAKRHAGGLVGVQSFMLHGCFGAATPLVPKRFLPFAVPGMLQYGPIVGGAAGMMTEAPTGVGMTQQSMRLLEVLAQGAFAERRAAGEAMMRLIVELRSALTDAQAEGRELWIVLKEVFARLMEAERKVQFDIIAAKRNAALVQEFARYFPALLNGVTGRDIFPVAAGDTALMRGMARLISDDQLKLLGRIAEAGGPEKAAEFAVLTNRLNDLRKEEAAHDAKIDELAGEALGNDYLNATRDAAGEIIRHLKRRVGAASEAAEAAANGERAPHVDVEVVRDKPALAPTSAPTLAPAPTEPAPAPETPNVQHEFAEMFFGRAAEKDIEGLAGIMRMQGQGDLADKLIEAAKWKKIRP